MYPAITATQRIGDEPILSPDKKQIGNLIDFWRWAHSDLMGNAERGAIAEYIVATALNINHNPRVSWDKYDLLSDKGIAVEVKTSGYIQTWEQKTVSKLIFGIQPTHAWDSNTNEYETVQKRQADVYIFCVHKHTDQQTVNPLDISQWDFYLMPTRIINEKLKNQKTATLSTLIKHGAEKCDYYSINQRIAEIV